MRIFLIFGPVIALLFVPTALGQPAGRRTIGNTRQPVSARPQVPVLIRTEQEVRGQPRYNTPPSPTVVPVSNTGAGGIMIDAERETLPPVSPASSMVCNAGRPADVKCTEIGDVTLTDFRDEPQCAGYDFSDASLHPYDDIHTDVFFEGSRPGFFIHVYRDTDIQDLGVSSSLARIRTVPKEGWSGAKYLPLCEGHAYLVWTWDDQYVQLRVTSLSRHRLVFDWVAPLGDLHQRSDWVVRDGISRQVIAENETGR